MWKRDVDSYPSSTMRCQPPNTRFLSAAISVLLAATVALTQAAQAEIVLDEFDDSDTVLLPQMNLDYVRTDNVGSQLAHRSLRFVAFDTDPTGRFESNPNGSSSLVGVLESLAPRWDGDRTIHLQFWYDFDSIDATEAGRNDAFLLDFQSLSSKETVLTLRTFVGDDVTSRHNASLPLASSDHAVTVAVPFSLFTANFDKLESVHFSLGVRAPLGQNDMDFSMELDRVRIGRIPEPRAMSLVAILLGCVVRSVRLQAGMRRR